MLGHRTAALLAASVVLPGAVDCEVQRPNLWIIVADGEVVSNSMAVLACLQELLSLAPCVLRTCVPLHSLIACLPLAQSRLWVE